MYLDEAGKPAGYDVDLLNAEADLGVTLKIENLDFNGLIPGLQSKKFDMVSVGLNATDERKKVVDFSRAYVPYTSVLAVKSSRQLAGQHRHLEQGRGDDHRPAGFDRGDARQDDVPEGHRHRPAGPERRAAGDGHRARCRHRRRGLPARAIQQGQREPAEGRGLRQAARHQLRIVGRTEGQRRPGHGAGRVPVQGAERRHAGRAVPEELRRRRTSRRCPRAAETWATSTGTQSW